MPSAVAELLQLVETSLDDDKAENVVVIDLAGKTEIADFMVIANGGSNRQVGAMADHLQRKMKAIGIKGIRAEGLDNCDWVLIDAGDIIVHLFRPEVRDFYNLDKMWIGPAPKPASEPGPESGRESTSGAMA
ncbi:MAG: ribosome silencing factor [Rhodospirillales bacterium]|nr:ribosome silencing factor [Alphaproteobacteria bacterium]MBL6947575.1 ribosome silencing factor [Rhodospirillales bacterium]